MIADEFLLKDVWTRTMNKAVESEQISKAEIPYYDSKLYKLSDDEASVVVPSFINFSIMNQNINLLEGCLEEVIGKKIHIKICMEDEIKNSNSSSFTNEFFSRKINHNQTFTNFVVGKSNIQAQFASMTCAQNLGLVYNPLFIYGNAGLGKTHLLNAIGNKVKEMFPNYIIGYTSGPEFVEGVAKATKENRLDEFKQSFYSLDLLLIDDIQFIAGNKAKTHEIFFTIFNYLINAHKQICITADRTPNDIKDLEERIISRFNQGLNVNIEAPEFETSIGILKSKVDLSSEQSIDEEVFNFLATNFSKDVRSLEGALTRLLFYSIQFKNEDHITLSLATEAFADQIKELGNELTIPSVRKVVCDYYNLTKQQITSATRTKNIANARHIAMYLCRKLLDAPYDSIGQEFGKRDHTTVMASCEKVEKLIKTDPLYLKAINEIETKLK
ncbi:MAG: chromosomal replication initiator protein DnaA [Firmicutes bacterium]|nr:chromosomal replication initiator protein DnaA [Candidatus Colivicinus equi]